MAYERNRQAGIRHRQRRWWPLAAAFWMAIGLSPCALAAVGNLDCSHCPETVVPAEHAAHAGHASSHEGHAGHESQADSGHGGCADGDCLDGGDTLVDQRNVAKSGKSTGDLVFLPAAPLSAAIAVAIGGRRGTGPPTVAPLPSRRLHVINCVFLD
ncbi:MAG: hypothetical protein V2I25_16270 [Woeseiaceae bacterium]|jgi:hypothetical protein|nr:hypothetical protein [Woeseiaceae bacterium]